MMLPTIHLNGTSPEELRDQLSRAERAADALREALMGMAPHGRDYYPQGDDAVYVAVIEHGERLAKLNLIMLDIEALIEHVIEHVVRWP